MTKGVTLSLSKGDVRGIADVLGHHLHSVKPNALWFDGLTMTPFNVMGREWHMWECDVAISEDIP